MKYRITAICTAMIAACACVPVTAQAEGPGALHVRIDRVVLRSDALTPGAEVPVYVRLDSPHQPLTSLEFGINVDPRCTCRNVVKSKEARSLGGEPLDISIITSQTDNLSWNVCANGEGDTDSEMLMLVAVTLPENAGYGDCFAVDYLAENAGTEHCWKYAIDGIVVYSSIGQFDYESGYILIAPDRGDVNLDRTVDILDVIALNRYLLGTKELGIAERYAAETDGNDLIDPTDPLRVLKAVVGMIDLAEE